MNHQTFCKFQALSNLAASSYSDAVYTIYKCNVSEQAHAFINFPVTPNIGENCTLSLDSTLEIGEVAGNESISSPVLWGLSLRVSHHIIFTIRTERHLVSTNLLVLLFFPSQIQIISQMYDSENCRVIEE